MLRRQMSFMERIRTNATVHKAGVAMPANASQFKCIG
jgi:hypothetical protein